MPDVATALAPASVHPVIDRVLDVWPCVIARRAHDAITGLMVMRVSSQRPDEWTSSRLTGDGFPFELGFNTGDDRLRFTLEPGPATLSPKARLELAARAVSAIGGEAVPGMVMAELRQMISMHAATYGAWVGCRVGESNTICKLYVEVPAGAPLPARVPTPPALADRMVVPRMLAYAPATDGFELYVRVPSLEPRHLPAALASAGLETQTDWLLTFIADAYGHVIRGRLPGPSVGLSYAGDSDRRRVTLFLFARSLWGSDSRIRRAFSRLGAEMTWNPHLYLRATAPLAGREEWRTRHGMLGIVIDPLVSPSLSIGVRPATAESEQ